VRRSCEGAGLLLLVGDEARAQERVLLLGVGERADDVAQLRARLVQLFERLLAELARADGDPCLFCQHTAPQEKPGGAHRPRA
jgi:hypothetical protein